MGIFDRFAAVLNEPPPALAFEISEAGIAVARLRPQRRAGFLSAQTGGDLGFAAAGQYRGPGRAFRGRARRGRTRTARASGATPP